MTTHTRLLDGLSHKVGKKIRHNWRKKIRNDKNFKMIFDSCTDISCVSKTAVISFSIYKKDTFPKNGN